MAEINTVIGGVYKGSEINSSLDIKNYNRYLDKLTKSEVQIYKVIDVATVERSSFLSFGGQAVTTEYIIEVTWKNGDKSLVYLDHDNYVTFLEFMN